LIPQLKSRGILAENVMKIKDYFDYTIKKINCIFLELYVKITNKKFFCRALKGKSRYNTVINSDLTVSCNCNDRYGLGKLGNLNKQTLKQIFFGMKANKFRKSLENKKIPIVNCLFCPDFYIINKKPGDVNNLNKSKLPKGIMIENTVNCNLNCLSCNRDKICALRKKKKMSLKDIRKISKEIKKNKVKTICYFNLGEPFFSKDIEKELKIIKKNNPHLFISISTNGTLLDSKTKRRAALITDEIIFSIDGSTQKSLEKYQKKGNFNKAYNNMKELIKFRDSQKKKKPKIIWKYVLFRWNDNKKLIKKAINLAKKANVDIINFEKTLCPKHGASYKYYLNLGYLNKLGKFKNKIFSIPLRK